MLGIENIKVVVGEVIEITNLLDRQLADGKIDLTEKISLGIKGLSSVPKIIESASDFTKEIQDLDVSETLELHDFIANKFDLRNDKVENVIEKVVKVLLAIGEVFSAYKDSKV